MIMRFCFAVTGNLRFLSHLDFMQIWGRAARRGGIPIAYSQGFNPHPKLSFTPPRGVGMAGLAEYGDMELAAEISPEDFVQKLTAVLPRGVELRSASLVPQSVESLMGFVNAAGYSIILPTDTDYAELQQNIAELLTAESCLFRRSTPKGVKEVDLRRGIYGLELLADGNLTMELALGSGGRAADVLQQLGLAPLSCQITRTGLWQQDAAGVKTPILV